MAYVRNMTHTPNQGIDLETWNSESETSNNGLNNGYLSGEQAHPGQLQKALLFPGARISFPVPHWLSTIGLQSSQIVNPSLSKPVS